MGLRAYWEKLFPKINAYEKVGLLNQDNYEDEELKCESIENEDESHKVSTFNAFWNISNSIQGVAILAMPYVIKGGGWWSIVAITIVAMMSNYTGQILMDCHYEDRLDETTGKIKRVRSRTSYAEIGESVLPKYGKSVVLATQVLELVFMATLYPIVFVSVMNSLFSDSNLPSAFWVGIFGVLMLPNVFLRKLYHISLMSSLTVGSATSVFIAVSMYCLTVADKWHIENLTKFSTKEFIASVGVVIASYSSQMYLSVIEGVMQNPEKIGCVMNTGYSAMTFLKIGIGVVAYMTFGDKTTQVITLNLPQGFMLTTVNIIVVVLAMSSYSLPMFTAFEIIEKDSPWFEKLRKLETTHLESADSPKKRTEKEFLIEVKRATVRILLVLGTLIMAISVPHFCLVLSFIGSFTGAFLEMIFPCCFYLFLKHQKLSKYTILLNILIVIFSLFFMGIGMYFSAVEIITAFKLHTKEVWTID